MELKTNAQVEGAKQLTVKYAAMRGKAVAKKWEELKEDFVQYTIEIDKLQDTYPKVFFETKNANRSTVVDKKYVERRSENLLSEKKDQKVGKIRRFWHWLTSIIKTR